MSHLKAIVGSIAGLAAIFGASTSVGATYYIVRSAPDIWTVVDPRAIEPVPGPGIIRRAWFVRVQRNILTGDPPQAGYVRTLSDYDCVQMRARWREFAAFSRSGAALVSKRNPNPEWGPANEAPDILTAFKIVCQGEGGGSVVSADSVAKVVISLMASWDPPPTFAKPVVPVRPLPAGPGSAAKSVPARASSAAKPASK